jgi:hypothetical protein
MSSGDPMLLFELFSRNPSNSSCFNPKFGFFADEQQRRFTPKLT